MFRDDVCVRKWLSGLNILSEDPSKIDRTSVDLELEGYKCEVADLRRDMELFRLETRKRLRKAEQK